MAKKDLKETAAAIVDEAAEAKPKGRFASLVDEALADYEPAPPYPFDADPDRVVYITKPEDAERTLALASIIDIKGNIKDLANIKPMLESLCGEAFDYVWAVVAKMPVEVTIGLVLDMQDFFYPSIDHAQVATLPGGTAGSSS
jgi:hypothetical protein